jgi:4-amino-4-deoxy-L-arabinose transferase-like glycosyltransferase
MSIAAHFVLPTFSVLAEKAPMHRLQASALFAVLWALVYLPGLGSTEIKGEEGRRILPAVTMLETGNWLVPYVGGKPFLRKPPLVNWMIAGSFWITGVRNEWTARLPSALCVLALGLTIIGTSAPHGKEWIGPDTAFVAAVMVMTQAGLLAKARFAGAEIEGIYAPLAGMAIVWWLAMWARKRSPWISWLVPGVLLGFASLAKGPSLHLLFFYVVVVGVLWKAGEGRSLRHPAHFAALAVSAAMFAAWAVPYFQSPEAANAAEVWKRQGIDRFTDSDFNAGNYFSNIPRALSDQLPWVLFAPLIVGALRRRQPDLTGSTSRVPSAIGLQHAMTGVAWAAAGSFVVVLLIPGTLPRYVLPLGAPFALILAWALEDPRWEGAHRRWHRANQIAAALVMLLALFAPVAGGVSVEAGSVSDAVRSLDLASAFRVAIVSAVVLALGAVTLARRPLQLRPALLATQTAALLGACALLYTSAGVRWINRADNIRPLARAIDAAMPPGEELTIYKPDYLAAIFYLRSPHRYALTPEEIGTGAKWLLARGKERRKLAENLPEFAIAHTFRGQRAEEFLLLQRNAELQKLPAR